MKRAKVLIIFLLFFQIAVTPTLEWHKTNDAIAVKFVASYYRSLDFAEGSKLEANNI